MIRTAVRPGKFLEQVDRSLSWWEIHTAHGEPIGEFICEGLHKPFRALACPTCPSCRLTIAKELTLKNWNRMIKAGRTYSTPEI